MSTTPHDDVLYPILLRLPPPSLHNFKSVCKSWFQMISDSSFAEAHLKRANENKHNHHKIIFLKNVDSMISLWLHRSSVAPSEALLPPRRAPGSAFFLAGSLNGIVCFVEGDQHFRLFFTNPVIGLCKYSTPFPKKIFSKHCNTIDGFVFGFDSAAKEYKVLVIILQLHKVHVYNLGNDSWTEKNLVAEPPTLWFKLHFDSKVILHGSVHWVADSLKTTDTLVVAYFDFKNEELRQMYFSKSMPTGHTRLTLCDGCLSAIVHCPNEDEYHVWVMKQYGVVESWTKWGVIPNLGNPLGFNSYGEFLLEHTHGDKIFISYDPANQMIKDLGLSMDSRCGCQVEDYVESLVSF